MKNYKYRNFWLASLAGVLIASAYPVYMTVSVIAEMAKRGAVPAENYPKYIIPYAPIAAAALAGVLLMPLFQRFSEKRSMSPRAILPGAGFSIIIFLAAERIMETKILVEASELVELESWQMSMCYVPPEQYRTRTWEAVDILLGGYSPAFKLHFYLISAVVILSLINSVYGFAAMIRSGNDNGKKALVIQTAAGAVFLGMCIWACFTSFYRTGEISVPPVSAALMSLFFALLGMVSGMFTASFTSGKVKALSVVLPAAVSSLTVLLMYIGEMILLSGNLYRFGTGFFFDGLGPLVMAPADVLVTLLPGAATAGICYAFCRSS